MNDPTVYSVFRKDGIHTYRPSAYLQFGTATTSLGAVTLLNPGAAGSDDPDVQEALKSTGNYSGIVKPDPTMRQLIKFVNRICTSPDGPNGQLHIYNLFSLQGAKAETAIDTFESQVFSGLSPDFEMPSTAEIHQHPWFLIGWGLKRKERWGRLQERRKRWICTLEKEKIAYFGKPHPKIQLAYYHPCPMLEKNKEPVLNDLVAAYKTVVN
ncbi:hypothetical protein [Alicyclobacillus sp. SO9]|uniref:hypothetical protein n=1 Tax=Alicyclobacillus sp. SO9 TaxID=2665646 RepID=UPI0018E6E222|nr:hypothetical protein [Alicyclobacillus sp. SO9]QQE80451.1 hypothetical protein GI364_08580 [Alicyclobacillus sp. SO9]